MPGPQRELVLEVAQHRLVASRAAVGIQRELAGREHLPDPLTRAPASAARRGPTRQSTSNHAAYGEAGPSRRTDHRAAFCQAGVGTAMWLGTTSDHRAHAGWSCKRAATRTRRPSRPPSSAEIEEWSTTSYPWVEPLVAVRIGDR